MPSYDPELFNVDPYYDDYDQNKKFLKMLFRPGYALQARELSQIQSILQNQIERFGNFVFDDGSIVYGGQISEISTKTGYLTGLSGAGVSPEDLNDTIIEINDGNNTGYAKIVYGMTETRPTQGDFNVIFYQFLSGTTLTGGSVEGTYGGLNFTATLDNTIDNSLVIFVDEGIRYTNGYFVLNEAQRLGLFTIDPADPEKYYYENVSSSVGFDVKKNIVTSLEDETLKDPAFGSYNFNAPGADRFKIDLVINQKSLTSTAETVATDPFSRTNFIEFVRVFEGEVVKKEKYADLGALEDTLARRTYDESGNYVVDPFELSTTQNSSNTNELDVKLDTGKAYIFGYEFETQGSVIRQIRKARDNDHVSESNGFDLANPVGPYILVNFSGIPEYADGLSFGYGLSSYFPKIYFDSSNGYPSNQVLRSPIDSVKFSINQIPEADTFVPGLTLYASSNPDMGINGTADAEILGIVKSVRTEYTDSNLFATLEVVPPFQLGLTAISQGISFEDGLTSFFTTYDTFFVSGGSAFEQSVEGYSSQVFSADSNSVTFFRSIDENSITGGIPIDIFGDATIKNIQILSGDNYKLFLGDINLNDNRSISEIKRIYLGGNEPSSYYAEPTFFTSESSPNTYSPNGESLVYFNNFEDEVYEFTNLEFAIDVTRTIDTFQFIGTSIPGGEENENAPYVYEETLNSSDYPLPAGSSQWGLNFSASEIPIPVSSSSYITIFNEDGPIDCLFKLANSGGGSVNPDQLKLYFKEPVKQPITLITSHVVEPIVTNTIRKKILVEETFTESDSSHNIDFISGVGNDEGYWITYIEKGQNYESDVYEIVSFTSNNVSVPFEFDNGQKDSYYDFSKIKIKKTDPFLNGNPANTEIASYSITYRKFLYDEGRGPFIGGALNSSYYMSGEDLSSLTGTDPGVNNRTQMPFELIPSFTSKDGALINLRNCVDFRPLRKGKTDSFELEGPYDELDPTLGDDGFIVSSHPYSGYDNFLEYKNYLSRIDRIYLNRNKTFSILEGIPSRNPQAPSENPESMTLYSIIVNPYTFNENDVSIKQENNRRYTMRDIGELEKRIEKIEYYSTLNSLELEAKTYPIYDSLGIEVPKKAVLADQFINANSADVLNPDFTTSINKNTKELKPNFETYELSPIDNDGSINPKISFDSGLTYDSENGIVTFNYDLTTYLENNLGNSSRKINSNAIINYNGSLKISPQCDRWFDISKNPVVKTNTDGANDYWYSKNPFSRNDSFWDFNWFGKENTSIEKNYKKSTPTRNFSQRTKPISENKIGSFFSSESNSFSYNDKVLERSISPYIRQRTIKLEAKGLKPNTDHYIYFDNVLQTTSSGSSTIKTNEYGEFNGSLNIPSGTYLSGKKLIRITDTQIDPDNPSDLNSSTSSADAIYIVSGNIRDQNSLDFIKPIITKREASDSSNITSNAVTRDFQRSGVKSKNIKDTLSQLFTVDYSTFKSGIFVKQIDVYLDGYPTSSSNVSGSSITSKLPIRLQLKPVVSGYPNISKVITEAYVYDVETNPEVDTINNFSDDIPQVKKVKFVFDYPVYLSPGDYVFSLDSNSDEYSVVTYILPSIQRDADKTSQDTNISSLFGSIFLPKNVGSFEKITNEFITTTIHRCNFTTNSPQSITKTLFGSDESINEFRLNVDYIEPISNTLDVEINDTKIIPNKTIDFDKSGSLLKINFKPSSNNSSISPVLDLTGMNSLYTKYKLPSLNVANELKPRFLEADSESGSRYISKTINLERPAKSVVVRFDKIEPPNTTISVFVKPKIAGSEKGMGDINYILMSSTANIGKTTSNSFLTDEYKYTSENDDISSFNIKIVLSSSTPNNTSAYPKIKNLTITAV